MTDAINKILIPVDFSVNTEIALNKASDFLEEGPADIHLLHAVRPNHSAEGRFNAWEAARKLGDWKDHILDNHPTARVFTHILQGNSIQPLIIECAQMIKPDLIIIGKQNERRRWTWFRSVSPNTIAQKSNCPVLTAKPGSILNRTKVILIPVRHFFPERKLELGIFLAKKYKAQVHLLAIQENKRLQNEDLSPIFLKAYHKLREKLHHPVEYSAVSRHSAARATLDYAEMIMADMILVNPETESGIHSLTGFWHISDWLGRDSKIQVMDVEPYAV